MFFLCSNTNIKIIRTFFVTNKLFRNFTLFCILTYNHKNDRTLCARSISCQSMQTSCQWQVFRINHNSNYLYCSQVWFPTVQEVLQADWHDVWHSPHPPFLIVFCNFLVFNVFTCFIRISPLRSICNIIAHRSKVEKTFFACL